MVTDESIMAYMARLHNTDAFDELNEEDKQAIIFTAQELLKDYFDEEDLTDRIISLQILYMLESDSEEFANLKRHGISSYSVKGVSVSFDDSSTGFVGLISPLVAELLEAKTSLSGPKFGRLI